VRNDRRIASLGIGVSVLACATLASTVALPRAEAAPPAFFWTISASDTDPWVNRAEPRLGFRSLYLWFVGGSAGGMSSAEFRIAGTLTVLELRPMNNFRIDGTQHTVSYPGCANGPMVAAELVVLESTGGGLCLAPSLATRANCTASCSASPARFTNSYVGYASDGGGPCVIEAFDSCAPISVEPRPWGAVKGRYR
jgi:hypothetical protein